MHEKAGDFTGNLITYFNTRSRSRKGPECCNRAGHLITVSLPGAGETPVLLKPSDANFPEGFIPQYPASRGIF